MAEIGEIICRVICCHLKDLGLELVLALQLAEEGHGVVEQVEGIHHHDLALATLKVAQLACLGFRV